MAMSDWNDLRNGAQMVLSTTQHQEGAKSLRIIPTNLDYGIKVLTASVAAAPKQVNYDFWTYIDSVGNYYKTSAFFRVVDVNNYYSVEFHAWDSPQHARFYHREAGVLTEVTDNQITVPYTQWAHWKILFCETANTVYCDIYREVSSAWVLQTEFSHNPAKFTSGGAFGIGYEYRNMAGGGVENIYIDNAKVYYV